MRPLIRFILVVMAVPLAGLDLMIRWCVHRHLFIHFISILQWTEVGETIQKRPEAKIDRVPLPCDSIIVRLYLMLEWWRLSYRHGGLRLGTGVMQLQASPIEIAAWLWHRPIRILTVESISRLQSNRSGCGNEMCDSLEERFAIGPVCVARPRLGRERSGQEEQEEADHPPLDPLDAGWALRMLS